MTAATTSLEGLLLSKLHYETFLPRIYRDIECGIGSHRLPLLARTLRSSSLAAHSVINIRLWRSLEGIEGDGPETAGLDELLARTSPAFLSISDVGEEYRKVLRKLPGARLVSLCVPYAKDAQVSVSDFVKYGNLVTLAFSGSYCFTSTFVREMCDALSDRLIFQKLKVLVVKRWAANSPLLMAVCRKRGIKLQEEMDCVEHMLQSLSIE